MRLLRFVLSLCLSYRLRLVCLALVTLPAFSYYLHQLYTQPGQDAQALLKNDDYENSICTVPVLNPWDPSILHRLEDSLVLRCNPSKSLLPLATKLQDGFLSLDTDYIERITFAGEEDPLADWKGCWYRCIDRVVDNDDKVTYHEWTKFQLLKGTAIDCEFVGVQCDRHNRSGYAYIHTQIVPNKTRLAEAQETLNAQPQSADNEARPSVLLFVIDATSRSMFRRRLPRTYRYLTEQLGAFEPLGYSKVGLNSLPNGIAFLTGRNVSTNSYELPKVSKKGPFDSWPFIFKEFHRRGYITYMNEDWGLLNYLTKGFRYKPTDHYIRPFWRIVLKSGLFKTQSKIPTQEWCYGKEKRTHLLTKNLLEFLQKYPPDQPKWALLWEGYLAHEEPGNLAVADDNYLDFFTKARPLLNNTFVFVLADHGNRYSQLRWTEVGRLEENLPMFAVVVPERFRRNPSLNAAFRQNKMGLETHSLQRLASHWDLYVTMWDILLSAHRDWNFSRQPADWLPYARRGFSLLRPLPARNCSGAGVPEEFCVCDASTAIDVNGTSVREAVRFAISQINDQILDLRLCHRLTLREIVSASSLFRNTTSEHGLRLRKRIMFMTLPNNGLFEVLLDHNELLSEDDSYDFTIHGSIDRINKYGDQPFCLDDVLKKPYCYCKTYDDHFYEPTTDT